MRMGWQPMSEVRTFSDLERIEINHNVSVMPIPVPHDDADNVAFIIFSGGKGLPMSLIWVKPPMS